MLLGLFPLAWSKARAAFADLSGRPRAAYQPVVIAVSAHDLCLVMPKTAWPCARLTAQLGPLTLLGEAEHPALRSEGACWTRVAVEMAFFGYSTVSFDEAMSLLG